MLLPASESECEGRYDVEAEMAAEDVVAMDECGGGSKAKAGTADDAAGAALRRNDPPRCAVRAHSSSDSAGEGTDEDELEDDDEEEEEDEDASVLDVPPALEPVAVAEALVLRFLIETEAAAGGGAVGGNSCTHVALS